MPASSIIKTAFDALTAKASVLSVGYKPIDENEQQYKELLNLICSNQPSKRQSPLVNAGYAVRLSVVTSTVRSFLHAHREADAAAQLVILGSGLDVMGLWAHSLLKEADAASVTICELDTPEIVAAKKDILIEKKLLKNVDNDGAMLKGRIAHSDGDGSASPSDDDDEHNYYLLACDLRELKTVEQCLSVLDTSKPTLVVSELVLTYLGRQPMDDLLRWCSSQLCVAPGSAMASFEVLGPKSPIRHSVLEGYKQQYCQSFVDKLSRGLAKYDPDDLFHPLGCDAPSAEARYRNGGFKTSLAELAGFAFVSRRQQQGVGESLLQCPEPFDEHMALELHLRSYVLAVGFTRLPTLRLVRALCPWSSAVMYDFPSTVTKGTDGEDFTIRLIEAKDQESVRDLYRQTYESLFSDYSSVRKMVKTGLKTDLSCNNADDLEAGYSSIGSRFGMAGGAFLVAVDNDALLGCVGLKRCQSRDTRATGDAASFEIHRLAVATEKRGRGVGKSLLSALDSLILNEIAGAESYNMMATTPAILNAANSLYLSCGFELSKEEAFGKLTINTYSRLSKCR